MSSVRMKAVGLLMRLTRRRRFLTEAGGVALLARPKEPSQPPARLAKNCDVRRGAVSGFDVYVVKPKGGPTVRDAAVVYLHGGAFVNEIAKQHWALIAQIADEVGCEVHVPIYGLAPQHDWSQAGVLVTEVVTGLTSHGRTLAVVGDSAGGTLALLAAQAAVARGDTGIRRVTLIAPWLDMSLANPAVAEVAKVDPWLALPGIRPLADSWAAGVALDDPRLSPLFGPLRGLPPLEIWVGTHDITVVDCRDLRERLPVGTTVKYREEPGAIHVYPLLPVPEGRRARQEIIAGIRASLVGAATQ